MNNGSRAKKTRKPVRENTKAKLSKSVKNAYNRNKAAANTLGLNIKTFRSMKKAGTKKNARPRTPNFNPFNNALNAMPARASGAPNPFNMFNMPPTTVMPVINAKKSNSNKVNRSAKMSAAQKGSIAASSWMANVKKVQNAMGVSRKEAMVIASEKRKEKAGTMKSRNNANLLGLSNLSISNKKSNSARKYNENLMSTLGM